MGLLFRPAGLRFRPVGLRFRPVGLRFRPVGLRFRPAGLRFRPQGLRFRPLGLRFRPLGLRFRPLGLRFRPQGLRFRPVGLRTSVFVFGSFSTHPYLALGSCGIQESDVKIKGAAANCVAIASAVIAGFEIPKRRQCTTGFLPYCRSSRPNTRFVRKVNAFCKQASNVLSSTQNFKTFD